MGDKDDEDDDPGTLSGVKYPCMPSLVALQQMRNRLHLAHLGKKLMKWSALASGREMRRVAALILEAYDGFEEECAKANMLLARCRFFCPDLNKIVLENIQAQAALTVSTSMKTCGGVKMKVFEIEDKEPAPKAYPHLGLGAGGQTIKETKIVWAALLKRFMWILELREAFEDLNYAFKSSTKKENVLGKLIIPRLNVTIHYILQELEELQREELFRIKKVVQYKAKAKEKKKEKNVPEPKADFREPVSTPNIMGPLLTADNVEPLLTADILVPVETPAKPPKLPTEVISKEPPEVCTAHKHGGVCTSPIPGVCPPHKDGAATPVPIKLPKLEQSKKVTLPPTLCVPPKKPVQYQKHFRPDPCIGVKVPECCSDCIKNLNLQPRGTTELARIDFIQKKLEDLLRLSKGLTKSGHVQYEPFSRGCEDLINEFRRLTNKEDTDIETLRKLASHIRNVIETTKKIQSDTPTTSLHSFTNMLVGAKNKLHSFISRKETVMTRENLDAIGADISEFKLMASNKTIDNKIKTDVSASYDGKNLINDIAKNKQSTRTEQFLEACADFKNKIAQFKGEPPKANSELCKLVKQLDEAITLSSDAKESGLIDQNVDKFIASCENFKKNLLKSDNVSETFETFLESCETTKEHIEKCIRPGHSESENLSKTKQELHNKILDYIRGTDSFESVITPQHTAFDEKKKVQGAQKMPTAEQTKSKELLLKRSKELLKRSNELLKNRKELLKNSKESFNSASSSMRGSDKTNWSKDERIIFDMDVDDTPDKDDLGAFDNTVKKIVKIKRVLNDDGTITEHVDTVTIKVDQHDPDDFSLGADQNLSDYDTSITSSTKPSPSPSSSNRKKQKNASKESKDIRHCAILNQINLPFAKPIRKVNSEICSAVARKTPILRNSMSEITFNKPAFNVALMPL